MKSKSFSEIARNLADRQISEYFYYTEEYEPTEDDRIFDIQWVNAITDVNTYLDSIKNSYRAPIIKHRAMKRFVRVMKKKGVL